MFLSRMQLDLSKRDTMRALNMPNLFHGAVESAFFGERKRRLWRLDYLNGKLYLMVLSEDRPDLKNAARQFGFDDREKSWEIRDYTPLLNRISSGSRWNFRLRANPTKSCVKNNCAEENGRGKVFAHKTIEYQEQWLRERAGKNGFRLEKNEYGQEQFMVVDSQWYSFSKGNKQGKVTMLSVTYEGILVVTDVDQFKKTLINGMGRGKAYGNGLLTVMHIQEGDTE